MERSQFQEKIKLKRAEQKAKESKQAADEARRELVKERAKNAQLEKQMIMMMNQHTLSGTSLPSSSRQSARMEEMAGELAELTRCFEKSEMIRKQQKTLISRMKVQIEEL